MTNLVDGPASKWFSPLPLSTGLRLEDLPAGAVSDRMARAAGQAPRGDCVAWGIPFRIGDVVLVNEQPASLSWEPFQAGWLVCMHTADARTPVWNAHGFVSPASGEDPINEPIADYVFLYADGSEERAPLRRRHQVCTFAPRWGENGFVCVPMHKPQPVRAAHEQLHNDWGNTQTRVSQRDDYGWMNWLWAWQNPHPGKPLVGMRCEPRSGTLILSAVSRGTVTENPLRWRARRKATLRLPDGEAFQPDLDAEGLLSQIRLDLGQVISAQPRLCYPDDAWEASANNRLPQTSQHEILVEYTAHPDAAFHLSGGQVTAAADVENAAGGGALRPVAPAERRLLLQVRDRQTGKQVAAKLHMHGAAGEYLPPVDRHRIINAAWFEDYSVDFAHQGLHPCTYIPGETLVNLPLGKVYVEVSKGFEIRPVRKVIEITPETEGVVIEVERVLPWREKGWVTADTHVHFLSPASAMLEGAGEGVNVVNLLASQWGELMTNVGDFDGKTTWGENTGGGGPEGNGEYLVRVGTENRQQVLGHISLLGYHGRIIAPMTVGGPDESALGDPVDVLLTDWARQCKAQGGLVVLPHFPYPRAEHAASIVAGAVDAVEMTSWGDLYSGIDPYSLSDWYRYLNCGYLVPAVGGTDKMWAGVAVGAVRTYARIDPNRPFTYAAWMDAVRRAETFVTYGPLVAFAVEGKPAGSRIAMPPGGGTLEVTWQVASVTVPMTRVDLIVNGTIRESATVGAEHGAGSWRVPVGASGWMALLVRGHYPDRPEIITAHTSPVFVEVDGSEMLPAADAITILEQIEGALAYIDTIGTRAEDRVYKQMRLSLTAAHRALHNRMHRAGKYHDHTPTMGHAGGHNEAG
jgi:hypothetical protein